MPWIPLFAREDFHGLGSLRALLIAGSELPGDALCAHDILTLESALHHQIQCFGHERTTRVLPKISAREPLGFGTPELLDTPAAALSAARLTTEALARLSLARVRRNRPVSG